MRLIYPDSLDDPVLAVFRDQPDSQLRSFPKTQHGLFIGESRNVIERALDAGIKPYAIMLERHWLEQTMPLLVRLQESNPDLPIYVVNLPQFEKITGYRIARGAIAALERPALPSVLSLLSGAQRVAVLEDITNYTNIGAIFRSAAALGIDAVFVTPSCHDPLYRRASRVSMGTVFQVPWTRIGTARDWAASGIPLLHKAGFKVAALALSDDSIPLGDPQLASCKKLALVLGTEGDGLSHQTIAACDYTVRIPMEHGVDSLNVAAASAVAFWELRVTHRS
ncbi:MAG: TrmH family RNA methyltransferase [Eggerthellaceae bacterium]